MGERRDSSRGDTPDNVAAIYTHVMETREAIAEMRALIAEVGRHLRDGEELTPETLRPRDEGT
jgi:hypothetical protein